MIAPHEAQARKNHGQSLKTLAERGGLAPSEALAVLNDKPWREYQVVPGEVVICRMNVLIV